MKWSWRIARIAGIAVHVHVTFGLFLGAVLALGLLDPTADVLFYVGVLFAVLGCVLLHELGHAFTARGFGLGTKDITLLPIGGVARLERQPKDPAAELWIALAGPAVNFALALALAVVVGVVRSLEIVAEDVLALLNVHPVVTDAGARRSLPEMLFAVNLFLGAFNLLPGFPMDGGRVLRALFTWFVGLQRATRFAARVGIGLALLFAIVGFLRSQPMLVVVGLFVFLSGRQESAMTITRSLLDGLPVKAAMTTRFFTLPTFESLEHAASILLSTAQQDFPVVGDDGRYLGMLTKVDLLRELTQRGREARVIDAARRGLRVLSPTDLIPDLFDQWSGFPQHALPVLEEDKLVGLLSADGIQKALLVREALATR